MQNLSKLWLAVAAIALASCGAAAEPAGAGSTDVAADAAADVAVDVAADDAVAIVDIAADSAKIDAKADAGADLAKDVAQIPCDPKEGVDANPAAPYSGTGPIAAGQYVGALATAYCEMSLKCPFQEHFASKAACESGWLGYGLDDEKAEVANVKAKTSTFNAEKAAACIAAIKAEPCVGAAAGSLSSCDEVFVGTVKDEGPCRLSSECTNGTCGFYTNNSQGCAGKCAPKAKTGAECFATSQCAVGQHCFTGKCTDIAEAKKGQDCESTPCATGLFCLGDEDGLNLECTAQGDVGAECDPDSLVWCKEGLYCEPTAKFGVCAKPFKIGDVCTAPSEFASVSLPCGATAVCMETDVGGVKVNKCVSKKKLGEGCTASVECDAWDAYCNAEVGKASKCALLPGKGDACALAATLGSPFSCIIPLVCDKATNKCADPPAQCGSCEFTESSCAAGNFCIDQVCRLAPKAGQDCNPDSNAPACAVGLECSEDTAVCEVPVCK